MASEAQIKAQHLYVSMLEEVKVRIDCINIALNGNTNLPERGAIEFCYLQIRMLCELIALGCLVVHGDIEQTRSLHKTWAADEIVKRLGDLHPDFYPHPVRITFPNPGHVHIEKVESGFLTKDDLIKLVGLSGNILHRGSLKTLVPPNRLLSTGFQGVRDWGQRIVTLIEQHRIGLLGGNAHFVCALANVNNEVQVAIAELPLSSDS